MQYTLKRLMDTKPELAMQLKQRCYAVNGCCAAVHRELGPFLNEYMYQEALQILLDEQQVPYQREYYFTLVFHGKPIQHKHYVDFVVDNDILVECKAVEKLIPDHRQQLWNYMRLTGKQIGTNKTPFDVCGAGCAHECPLRLPTGKYISYLA